MKISNFLLNKVDNVLNNIPMYTVVLYSLILTILVSFVESHLGFLPYTPKSLFISLFTALFVCIVTNIFFAKSLKLPLQFDSSLITALIIFLILLPVNNFLGIIPIVIASFLAIASKYILVLRNTHVFNPAAFGIFATTFLGYFFQSFAVAFWWVGSLYLLPITLVTGFFVVRKTRKHFLFFASISAGFLASLFSSIVYGINFLEALNFTFISGPIIFFVTIMLTEPHTITKNKSQQIFYGFLIILLPVFVSYFIQFNITPEFSLLIGNLISFIISQRTRFILKLKEIKKLNDDTFEYIFENSEKTNKNFNFSAGEFMEWDLQHAKPDSRGMRRYFTISSCPNENQIAFATKFPPKDESSFKKALKEMKLGDTIYATQLGGDFLLPESKNKNIIMIAGGIGITPFISQLRDLLSQKQKIKDNLSIALFYCVRSAKDIVYNDLLKKSIDELGLKVIYVVSDNSEDSEALKYNNSFYESGYITKEILNKYTQNMHNEYYISGPNVMVEASKKILLEAKNKIKNIHTDYFPGF